MIGTIRSVRRVLADARALGHVPLLDFFGCAALAVVGYALAALVGGLLP